MLVPPFGGWILPSGQVGTPGLVSRPSREKLRVRESSWGGNRHNPPRGAEFVSVEGPVGFEPTTPGLKGHGVLPHALVVFSMNSCSSAVVSGNGSAFSSSRSRRRASPRALYTLRT